MIFAAVSQIFTGFFGIAFGTETNGENPVKLGHMVLEKYVRKSVYRIIDFTVVFGLHIFQSTKQSRIPGDFFGTV